MFVVGNTDREDVKINRLWSCQKDELIGYNNVICNVIGGERKTWWRSFLCIVLSFSNQVPLDVQNQDKITVLCGFVNMYISTSRETKRSAAGKLSDFGLGRVWKNFVVCLTVNMICPTPVVYSAGSATQENSFEH